MNEEIEKIKKNVNFAEYLEKIENFQKKEDKSTSKYPIYKKDDLVLMLFKVENIPYQLAKHLNSTDTKAFNLIQYLQKYKKLSLKEIKEQLSNQRIKNSLSQKKNPTIKNTNNNSTNYYDFIQKWCTPLKFTNNKYLNNREIKSNTINHKKFSNLYYNQKYQFILIPNYKDDDKNVVTSYEMIKNTGEKRIKEGSTRSFYQTINNGNEKNLIITEGIVNLLSYYSLKNKTKNLDNTAGVSLSGQFGTNTIKGIKNHIKNNSFFNIILATDNDEKGNIFRKTLEKEIQNSNDKITITKMNLPENQDLNDILKQQNKTLVNTSNDRERVF